MDLLAEKARKIAARRQAAKKLSSDVDAELRGSEGCFPCALFRRKKEAATAADVEAAGAAASAAEGRVKAGAASALFGLAKKQASPVESWPRRRRRWRSARWHWRQRWVRAGPRPAR
jgi:hypothetical protein